MTVPSSKLGQELWRLIPTVYRAKDEDSGHLAEYLDAYGTLFDRLKRTLEQRLADSFPNDPAKDSEIACQDWVLPYLADLLDVRLLSPHADGRRTEVGQAVRWRKRKGTVVALEEIGEGVGQLEVEVQEGWRRVARTARLAEQNAPPVTTDQGGWSRAVETEEWGPLAKVSRLGGREVVWRHSAPTGVPCFPDSYEDISLRTVDVRTPDWRRGHHHPRRVVLYAPPPMGFFEIGEVKALWSERDAHSELFKMMEEDGEIHLFNPARRPPRGEGEGEGPESGVLSFTSSPPTFSSPEGLRVEDLKFERSLQVDSGVVKLDRVAVQRLVIDVDNALPDEEVLDATHCLFDEVEVVSGTARLEHCTVLSKLECPRLLASDCVFPGTLDLIPVNGAPPSCVRFSRVPPELLILPPSIVRLPLSNTTDVPIFYDFATCKADGSGDRLHSFDFGSPGCGVLHPATSDSICFGAEDGGEMGAFALHRYRLASAAILEKLSDFLPVGVEAVLVPDPRLVHTPPSEETD